MKINIMWTFLIVLLCSCITTKKQAITVCEDIINESELKILSTNCEYVDEVFESRMKPISSNLFQYDKRLVYFWSTTKCLLNRSYDKFESTRGKATNSSLNNSEKLYHYKFIQSDNIYSLCTFVVMDDKIIRNYCLTDVKVTTFHTEPN